MKHKQAFTLSRHAEFISASSRYQNNKTLKQVQGDGRKGFTLIELLVVVLIIGILAAVALPQYQLAVAKSRVVGILPIISSIRKAEHMYYLTQGSYTHSLKNLDLTIIGDAGSGGIIHEDFHLNMNFERFILSYCPSSGIKNGSQLCQREAYFLYTEYYDNSKPRSCDIRKNEKLSAQLCQILLNS